MSDEGGQCMKLEPGQMFRRKRSSFTEIYILLSKDKEEDGELYWKCAVLPEFDDGFGGAPIKLLTDEEVLTFPFVGKIQPKETTP